MKEYCKSRWNRIKELEVPFDYIKQIVKSEFNNIIQEESLEDFIQNITKYSKIKEIDLLNKIEDCYYNNLEIMSIKKYKKNITYPICDDLTNETFNMIFKEKNKINFEDNTYYNGKLNDNYKIIYYSYNQEDQIAVIKLAVIKQSTVTINDDEFGLVEENEEKYDVCKFVINTNDKILFMHYNDYIENGVVHPKEVAAKKDAFRKLFENVNKKNMIKYKLDRFLIDYFKEYMEELRENNFKKKISIIKTEDEKQTSSIRSIEYSYKHRKKRLEAIEEDIDKYGNTICELETNINDVFVNVKANGELRCRGMCLNKEVVDNVSKELFKEFKIY